MRKIGVHINKTNTMEDLTKNIDNVFAQFKDTMMTNMELDKAEKLLYWLNQWSADYLKNENNFNYDVLIRYNKGSIVEADFGYNIGSEQGGLHYAIVLDNENNKSNRVLMVVPLESLPPGKDPNTINKKYEVFLGYGIFKDDIEKIEKEISKLNAKITDREQKGIDVRKLKKTLNNLQKELTKLRGGSVAQIAQVCALSKMRIYHPKKVGDKFSTFKLDDPKLKEIQDKIVDLYLNKNYKTNNE